MADVRVDQPGGTLDGAVLRGAASESTLQAILQKIGADGKGAKEATAMAKSMNEVTKSAKNASTSFDQHITYHKKFSSVIQDFGINIVKGTDKFGDFTSSLTGYMSQFGLGFTLVAQGIQRLVDELDQQIGRFRELSTVGADFGDSIFASRMAAIDAGLSLDTFQKAVKSNADTFALLGGNVNLGARRFTAISKVVQRDLQPTFSKYGMTMEDTTDMLADYLEIQTGLGTAQKMSNEELVQGTENYVKELDLLARTTGLSRKEASEALKLQQQDKMLKSLLMSMTAEQQQRLGGMLAGIEKTSPEMAAAIKELVVTGGAPISENAKGLALLNPNLLTMAAGLRDGSVSNAAFGEEMRRTAAIAAEQGKTMGQTNALAQLFGQGMFGAGAEMSKFTKFMEGSAEAIEDQKKAEESAGKVVADFSNQMRKLMNQIISAISPFLYAIELVMAGFTKVVSLLNTGFVKAILATVAGIGVVLVGLKGLAVVVAATKSAYAFSRSGKVMSTGKDAAMGLYDKAKGFVKGTGSKSISAAPSSGGGSSSGSKILESVGKGGPTIGASLKSLAGGLAAFGVKAPLILVGAAAVGFSITLIGAGIAGAAWLMGGAFSKFADDLNKFNSIDGQNLKSVASGAMSLSGAMATFGVSGIAAGFGKLFGGGGESFAKNINATLDSLDKGKIDSYTTALNGLSESFAGLNNNMSKTVATTGKNSSDKLDELNSTMKAMLSEMQNQKRFVKQTAENTEYQGQG
jgi:hypothetical protein